jgi:DNA polymerase alpha-associated DNA helicase A
MNQTMQRLQKMKSDEYSSFVRVLFGLTTPSPVSGDLVEGKEVEWVDPSLNDSQKDAIRFALASKKVALIHGPPGVSYLHSICQW